MTVDTPHPEYTKFSPQWSKLSDCAEGQDAIHKAGKTYLPELSEQTKEDYKAYLLRALFYNATSRTIDGLTGMVFRKEPRFEVPEGMVEAMEDVTLTGLDLVGFAEQIIDDNITFGRAGILVDHPVAIEGTTVATAETMNVRPFLKPYSALNIFNWRTASRNNSEVLIELRLWETYELPGEDEFDTSTERQIRVLDFNEAEQYRQRVFRQDQEKKKEWVLFEEIIPLMKGKALDQIPFFFVGTKNGAAAVSKPPLIDLANTNLSHYRSTADVEHGAHFTGLPTAVITGYHENDEKAPATFRIGASSAWVFPDTETKVEYLEFQGQGLEALEKRLGKKEEYMAMLGAQMLTPQKKGVEASKTVEINKSGETSVLSSLAKSTAQSIEDALVFMALWASTNGKTSFTLNNDFLAVQMSAQELLALTAALQAGGIAYADYLDNLKRGEIVNEDRTEDEIRSEIETADPFTKEDKNGLSAQE